MNKNTKEYIGKITPIFCSDITCNDPNLSIQTLYVNVKTLKETHLGCPTKGFHSRNISVKIAFEGDVNDVGTFMNKIFNFCVKLEDETLIHIFDCCVVSCEKNENNIFCVDLLAHCMIPNFGVDFEQLFVARTSIKPPLDFTKEVAPFTSLFSGITHDWFTPVDGKYSTKQGTVKIINEAQNCYIISIVDVICNGHPISTHFEFRDEVLHGEDISEKDLPLHIGDEVYVLEGLVDHIRAGHLTGQRSRIYMVEVKHADEQRQQNIL